ncbi:MAG: hypothetical protein AAB876_02280 [Patescibacteria group bacterium]
MLEQVSSEIRVHKAPENFLGQLGQTYLVLFFNKDTQAENQLGFILEDGQFSPRKLKKVIKEKEREFDAVTTPLNVELLHLAKKPIGIFTSLKHQIHFFRSKFI